MRRLILLISVFLPALVWAQKPFTYSVDTVRHKDNTEYRCFTKHINFKVGNKFRRINTSLAYRPLLKVWVQDSSNYTCRIPLYADDWFTFRSLYEGADYLLFVKPIAAHAGGLLIDPNTVHYLNAFGSGIDLTVEAQNTGLRKVITINSKPDVVSDMVFDFQIITPTDFSDIRTQDGALWDRESDLSFRDRRLKLGASGKEIYFNKAVVWDANGQEEPVDIKLFRDGLKLILRKTISAAFLSSAEYPVRTDHPTDYYIGSGSDGNVSNVNSSWSTCRSATTGSAVSQTRTDQEWVRGDYSSPNYSIARLFWPIDTSAIPDGDTIQSAVLHIYCVYRRGYDNDGNDFCVIVQTNQADVTSLSTADFDAVGSDEGSSRYDTDDLSDNSWEEITLNSTGLNWVNKTGYTLLGFRNGNDINNHAPTARNTHEFAPKETAYDSYLSVTTTSASATGQIIFISN